MILAWARGQQTRPRGRAGRGALRRLLVDARLRTSDPTSTRARLRGVSILISGGTMHLPLGSLANRRAASSAPTWPGARALRGRVGRSASRLRDGRGPRGADPRQAGPFGFDAQAALVVMADRAHFSPATPDVHDPHRRPHHPPRAASKPWARRATREGPVDAVAALLPHKPGLDDHLQPGGGYAPALRLGHGSSSTPRANVMKNILDGYSTRGRLTSSIWSRTTTPWS